MGVTLGYLQAVPWATPNWSWVLPSVSGSVSDCAFNTRVKPRLAPNSSCMASQ
ncbi:hypothetical protein ACN28S_05325 [Cystobacter fuscus]